MFFHTVSCPSAFVLFDSFGDVVCGTPYNELARLLGGQGDLVANAGQ
jgi:hypothetical protein